MTKIETETEITRHQMTDYENIIQDLIERVIKLESQMQLVVEIFSAANKRDKAAVSVIETESVMRLTIRLLTEQHAKEAAQE